MKEIIMSEKETHRIPVLEELIRGDLSEKDAAVRLHCSSRQIRRLKQKYKDKGIMGLIHKSRGNDSHNKTSNNREKIIKDIIRNKYSDFGPTFASEKLHEINGITISKETCRKFLIEEGLWKGKKKKDKATYRSWREPRSNKGILIQFDGSYEYWLEDRFDKCCLLLAVDDATGSLMLGIFTQGNESIKNVYVFWSKYLSLFGKPQSIYVDRFSTYKQNTPSPKEDIKTNFGLVMERLNIEVIFAHSPQAKGRIERMFGVLQDRLIKELRLENINDLENANTYLLQTFIPAYNLKFARVAKYLDDKHIPLDDNQDLNKIFVTQAERILDNDYTIKYNNQCFQLNKKQRVYIKPHEKIIIQKTMCETYILKSFKDLTKELTYSTIFKQLKVKEVDSIKKEKVKIVPPDTHPWKNTNPFMYNIKKHKSLNEDTLTLPDDRTF